MLMEKHKIEFLRAKKQEFLNNRPGAVNLVFQWLLFFADLLQMAS